MRTEVTYLERSPYGICSFVPLIIGGDEGAGDAGEAGPWAAAGATAPTVKPLANAALPFRNSRRAGRFEAISLSLMSLREKCVLAASIRPSHVLLIDLDNSL
jgi:hypothetical protein